MSEGRVGVRALTSSIEQLIRFLRIKCAFEVLGSADGANGLGVEAGLAPGVDGGRFEGRVIGVFAIRPVVAPQIVPKVFDRIEFRRIGRQLDQADVRRHLESSARVIAGTIPHQDGLHAGKKRGGELAEKGVDRIGVEVRRQNPFGRPVAGQAAAIT
jgi:hypothetical protein